MKIEDFPHLVALKKQVEKIDFGTSEYWKARCTYLEKALDETYSSFERSNCREFYRILVFKQK